MSRIAILSTSVRSGRQSHRAALHLERALRTAKHEVDLIDLEGYGFPVFNERLRLMKEPAADVLEFADRIQRAEGVIIVTPEYNGSFPASMKNVLDLISTGWRGKPISICAASGGGFAGTQVIVSLLFPLWKIKAWVVPSSMQVPKVQEAFNEDGSVALDPEGWQRRTDTFIADLEWAIEANRRMAE